LLSTEIVHVFSIALNSDEPVFSIALN
jgi:hypothetical protein